MRDLGTGGRGRARRLPGDGWKMPAQVPDAKRVKLLEPRDRRALDNINTPDEYARALHSALRC
jgi:molybdopterin-guanine dinucleotide biosynthesis protein A